MSEKKEVNLAEFRYQMMVRGYMNKKQLAQFMECGQKMANKAYDQMVNELAKDGVEGLNNGFILTKRAMRYIGLSEKNITDAYQFSIANKA